MPLVSAGSGVDVATWAAPANIAIIKYWGSHDPEAGLPLSPSLSMTLSRCVARCTVRRSAGTGVRVHTWNDGVVEAAPPALQDPVGRHVARILGAGADGAGANGGADVAVEVTFPVAAGLASSSAILAAVTLAAAEVAGLRLDTAALADLARSGGSGSAARSVAGGYTEWGPAAGPDPDPVTELRTLAPASHWDLRDVIALVDGRPKRVSSRQGHRLAFTSPYFERRLALLDERMEQARSAIADRDLERLGTVAEADAVDLHFIAMSSRPPIRYWRPATLAVLEAVETLRDEGVSAWATLDAGPNPHVLCAPGDEPAVAERLAAVPGVTRVLRDGVGAGPEALSEALL